MKHLFTAIIHNMNTAADAVHEQLTEEALKNAFPGSEIGMDNANDSMNLRIYMDKVEAEAEYVKDRLYALLKSTELEVEILARRLSALEKGVCNVAFMVKGAGADKSLVLATFLQDRRQLDISTRNFTTSPSSS